MKMNKSTGKTSIISLATITLIFLLSSFALAETDVTDLVELQQSRMMFNRRTGDFSLDVSLKNISDKILITPIKVVIETISNPGVTIVNPDGLTDDGKPYFEYVNDLGGLIPEEKMLAKRWIFSNPTRARFNYTTSVYATIPEAAAVIGPEGGVVEVTDTNSELFGFKMVVPDNAIEHGILIGVRQDSDGINIPSYLNMAGPIFHIELSEPIELKNYVYITIPYKQHNIPTDINEKSLMIYYGNENNEIIRHNRKHLMSIDTDNNLITFKTDHFSWWDSFFIDPSVLWDGRYDEMDNKYYTSGIDFLKMAKNEPELWNTIIGDPESATGIDIDKLNKIIKYDDLYDLADDYSSLNMEIDFYECKKQIIGEQENTRVIDLINDLIFIGKFIEWDGDKELADAEQFKEAGDAVIFLLDHADKAYSVYSSGTLISAFQFSPAGLVIQIINVMWKLGWDFYVGLQVNIDNMKINNLFEKDWPHDKITQLENATEIGKGPLSKVKGNDIDYRVSSSINCSHAIWKEDEYPQLSADLNILFGLYKFEYNDWKTYNSGDFPDNFFSRSDVNNETTFYGFIVSLFDMLTLCGPLFNTDIYPEGPFDICAFHADALAIIRHGGNCKAEYLTNSWLPAFSFYENLVYRLPASSECEDIYIRFIAWDDRPLYFSPWYKIENSEGCGGNIEDGLAAYYPFDGNADDESGNNNNADVINATLDSNGKFGQCYYFDGIDDIIEIPYNIETDVNGWSEGTLSLWFKLSSLESMTSPILFKNMKAGDLSGMSLSIKDGSLYGVEGILLGGSWSNGENIENRLFCRGGQVNLNQWHLATVAYTGNRVKLFLDGLLVAQETIPDTFGTSNVSTKLRIGDEFSRTRPFNGYIDDVRIYDRALSESEIHYLYTGGEDLKLFIGPEAGQVEEADLPNDTSSGVFYITADDGLAAFCVNNQDVTYGVNTITGTYGSLKITEFSGTYSWEYTLSNSTQAHSLQGNDTVMDTFALEVEDTNADTESDTLTITVVDDVPYADITLVNEDDRLVAISTDYGADDSGSTKILRLAVVGGSGADSGLNTEDGRDIYLHEDGEIVEGRAEGWFGFGFYEVVFELSLENDGSIYLKQNLDVENPEDPGNLTLNGKIYAEVTVNDGDGDMAKDSVVLYTDYWLFNWFW